MSSSVKEIRRHFPALRRRQNGQSVAYFDGPGGTQVPRQVGNAMTDYLYQHNANTHWAFPSSEETDHVIAKARASAAAFLNARPDEVVFGPNMTTLAFHLSRAIRGRLKEGDEIVITELDHHANIAPWTRLEKECGAIIKTVRMVPESGQLDWKHFEQQLGKKTKLVALGAASNALGTINDVRKAAELAHSVAAWIFVDAVHYAPHVLPDVKEFDCEFLACSSYKFYGPHLGILYGKRDLLESLDFPKLEPAPDRSPERAETGTQNHEGIAGAHAAIDFLSTISVGESLRTSLAASFSVLHERSQVLTTRMWSGLGDMKKVKLFGPSPTENRTPTVSFTVDGVAAGTVAEHLAKHGIFASHGDFYARTVVERLGVEGLVRAGCACYTMAEEVDRLLEAVSDIAR